ncbi:MAG: cytochrome C oxidase subunit IV family protein [Chloroflexi bacterium]|nr:cytochrome C oxidase subunit IV family protein [Chloroflexota bacterium]
MKELQSRLRLGWFVFVALVVLTVAEYYVVTTSPPGAITIAMLLVFQFADAGLIIWYFMHVSQLWRAHDAPQQRTT